MDYIKFETLDFSQRRGVSGVKYSKDTISVIRSNGIPSVLRFNMFMNDILERFSFMQVKRNPLTSQLYLVFNNEDGLVVRNKPSGANRDKAYNVRCRQLCAFLAQKFNKSQKDNFRLKISDDLSNDSRYATYEIIGKVEK